ncbi:uncharacterized protein DUF2628 [Pseudoduganella lurida]|uniref:Uncharacterized protein DUF2628 n=1 Tax=Pseudoduganella lurida TaxID=1036180 RepID=A0A562R3T2_9BURK|nr:DUF2628 domain-containing protein [Pseudoduganella lurida]TWI63513.1 uncharacterized protein DUF2628 [Pseudoduganella lurida]
MSICHHCGTHFITSPLCTACRPTSAIASCTPPEFAVPQRLPLVWREKFGAIDRAGGVTLAKLAQLPLPDRLRIRCNVFALLFGAAYYACKGMWKRGLSLALLMAALTLLMMSAADLAGIAPELARNVGISIAAFVYAYRANLDYYKQAVLGDDSWW